MKTKTGIAVIATVFVALGEKSFAQDVTGDRLNIGQGHNLGGSWATIAGGQNNHNSSTGGAIGGGSQNRVEPNLYGTIGGGEYNIVSSVAPWGTIGGGYSNQVRAEYGTVGGGKFNKNGLGDESSGRYGFIGGGYANTNGGESSVIVGGLNNTISSTSDYFWIIADGSSIGGGIGNLVATPQNPGTISGGSYNSVTNEFGFVGGGHGNSNGAYAGVIAGGYRNVSTGSNSVIGGGSDNIVTGTSSTISGGNANIVSGGWAVIGGGFSNNAANTTTVVAGGNMNIASGWGAAVGGGYQNTAEGQSSFVGAGQFNYANSINGTVAGGSANTNLAMNGTIGGGVDNKVSVTGGTIPGGANAVADKWGQQAYASGRFGVNGDAQSSLFVLRKNTTSATLAELFLNGVNRRMLIASNSTWTFEVQVSARTVTGDSAGYRFDGVIENVGGTVAIVGAVAKTVLAEDVASWDADVVADNVNKALIITVTGDSTNWVHWVSSVRTTEVMF